MSEHYDYYYVTGSDAKQLVESYEDIKIKRNEVLSRSVEEVGAAALSVRSGWGEKGTLINAFCFYADHKFPEGVEFKKKSSDEWQGKTCHFGRAKANSKEGKAFNKHIDTVMLKANKELSDLPSFQDFVIKHYGIMRCGTGETSSRGIAMISTYGGTVPGKPYDMVFAIPKSDAMRTTQEQVTIPAEFSKITYGRFYDIANSKDA